MSGLPLDAKVPELPKIRSWFGMLNSTTFRLTLAGRRWFKMKNVEIGVPNRPSVSLSDVAPDEPLWLVKTVTGDREPDQLFLYVE